MVVNAPQSNVLSAAEHTMALLLSQARNVPQAHAALKEGRWERSRWEGVELADKTLGIVGLGRIGKLVAQRALAFGMKLVAYDPFVAPERARQLSVELVDLDEPVRRADFVTLHLAKTKETSGSSTPTSWPRPSPASGSSTSPGAASSTRTPWPTPSGGARRRRRARRVRRGADHRVAAVRLDEVVVTPHLGASTREAQDKAGDTIADMVQLALAGDFVPFAVNVSAAEASETLRPFLPLAERLGRLYASLAGRLPPRLEIEYRGQLADYDTRILTLSVLKGVFGAVSDQPVTYVNAPQIAEESGVEVSSSSSASSDEYVNLVSVRGGDHAIAGTLVGPKGEPRITMIDDLDVDLPPARHLLVVRNDDRPG